jgi:PilZ domain
MTALELLTPVAADAVPFTLRPDDRRFAERADAARAETARVDAARADRRAHQRRTVGKLDWLSTVRLTGGTGYDVSLIDLSEGGALLEVNAPLRPGLILTLEMSGPGLDAAVPLEVVRCYIASLRGETATYRGAVAFAHLIQLPGSEARPARVAADFVGTGAALTQLLERCTSSRQAGASVVSLDRKEVLRVLDALRMRTSTRGSDLLSRHASDLLAAILPALHVEAPGDVAVAALEERLRGLPPRWRALLQPTAGQLASLIAHCVTAADTLVSPSPDAAALPVIWDNPTPASLPPGEPRVAPPYDSEVGSGFQKIVARYADGKILKGYAQDFYPTRPQFTIWPSITATAKERIVVPVSQLKAVFFVRDFEGNPSYKDRKAFGVNSQGRRVDVTFTDGESVLGTTLNYRPDGQGFFVTPADPDGNNSRIYVVAKSVRRVRFL